MATQRSRRLRKKLHIDEFQELGFSVAWRFPEGTSESEIDETLNQFINEAIPSCIIRNQPLRSGSTCLGFLPG